MPGSEKTRRRLTLVISGADVYEVSCPELRISYYSEDVNTAKDGLFRTLSIKANSLVKRNGTCPSPDLLPYARLFLDNQREVKEAIIQGRDVLVAVNK